MKRYSVKKLADFAGVSVRTLHYYDELGLLKPESRNASGYRYYGEEQVLRLQQIMFFRELGFSLDQIRKIVLNEDFDVTEALQSHRALLTKKSERIDKLLDTLDKTINKLKGEGKMQINEYYQGFSDEQIEKYRQEVRQRWGEKTLQESEQRIIKMGKPKFAKLQTEGENIFRQISNNMSKGFKSKEVQALVSEWRRWLENFSHYPDEAVLGLAKEYCQNPEFAKYFNKFDPGLPEFLAKAVEYCFGRKK